MSLENDVDSAMELTKTKVLIIDDSAVARQALSEILSADPGLNVVGTARDAFTAAEKLRATRPDVLTLDLRMPGMDGLTFLRRLMRQHPLPVVVCASSVDRQDVDGLAALEAGAYDVVPKPTGSKPAEARALVCAVKSAASCRRIKPRTAKMGSPEPKHTADVILPVKTAPPRQGRPHTPLFVIGASTGGTEALRTLLVALPADAPPTVIVQHMPAKFTGAFAKRLDALCAAAVSEAEDGELLEPGQVRIAPGDRHLLVRRHGRSYRTEIRDGPPVCRHRPSVDVLFRSAALAAGPACVAALLTGMGDDGARGMVELKAAGAFTVAQDKATCVVFGMPQEAIKRDAVDAVLPLNQISNRVLRQLRQED